MSRIITYIYTITYIYIMYIICMYIYTYYTACVQQCNLLVSGNDNIGILTKRHGSTASVC